MVAQNDLYGLDGSNNKEAKERARTFVLSQDGKGVRPAHIVDKEFDEQLSKIDNLLICSQIHNALNRMEKYSGLYRTMRPPVFCWSDPNMAASILLDAEGRKIG